MGLTVEVKQYNGTKKFKKKKQLVQQVVLSEGKSVNVPICSVFFFPKMTPLDVAVKRGHVKVGEFLRGMSNVSTHETVL